MFLIHEKTGRELRNGDHVTDFRGEDHVLIGLFPNDGMNGKVELSGEMGLRYPSVIGAKFVEE